MEIGMSDLTAMEVRAVAHAMKCSHRLSHPAYARDDMRQEAVVAVLLARPRCSSEFTPNEQEAYFARRALGGIVDGLREILRQDGRLRSDSRTKPAVLVDEGHASEERSDDSPDGNVAVSRAMESISKMPAPLPTVALMAIAGSSMKHIAEHLGVSPSWVTHLRAELAAKLRKHL